MRLTSLRLEQFRSYRKLELHFPGSGIDLFVGPNGSGKTNIVEAISFLSMGRSCLGVESQHMIRWGGDFLRARASAIADDGTTVSFEAATQLKPQKKRAYFLDDVRTPFSSFVGVLPTVLFLPQDLDLFTGAPALRRGFLDRLLVQLGDGFLALRLEYEKILKQRNALLKRIAADGAGEQQLDVWDSRLADLGAQVQLRRLSAITVFANVLRSELADLGERFATVELAYVRPTTGGDSAKVSTELRELLRHSRARDIAIGTTTVGPHRDDWRLIADGHDLALCGSRGQQRAAFLALLFSQLRMFSDVRREKPVLILDDVFSELDSAHQRALLDAFDSHHVLMTTTHVPDGLPKDSRVWDVVDGAVKNRTIEIRGQRPDSDHSPPSSDLSEKPRRAPAQGRLPHRRAKVSL